ncbi:hypothetical protein ACO1O0_005042 [Amphichorda felina]
MVDDRYLGGPGDIFVSGLDSDMIKSWTSLTKAVHEQGCPIIAQLNHLGRQSPAGMGKRGFLAKTIAPSAVPLSLGDSCIATVSRALVFGTPQAMTLEQIDNLVAQFTRAAKLAVEAGFDGVEIHAAHGFLISQFLLPSANKRTDDFGGSAEKRAELLLRVIRSIRREVPATFCVGVKVNSADHMNPKGLEDMLRQVQLIHNEQVDYIQLSGGSFEDPQMLSNRNSMPRSGAPSDRTIAREGFFLRASEDIRRRFPNLILFVTGGFRSREGVNAALGEGACDATGCQVSRAAHRVMFNESLPEDEARFDVEAAPYPGWLATKIRSIVGGAETKYWSAAMQKL